ncbi:hypothetical protein, partial [Fusobacterium necrophorum]|uniref:hypothetical protein n=1 Tax=Fusobacterium necrophorum TaxID=859 RepID=UPI00055C8957
FLYAQEGENPEEILNLSSQAEKLSKSDPDNNYIVTVSREEGINIVAVPKPKSWKDNLSNDFMKAKGTVLKYYRKSQDNWENGKYLSWAGNRIVSGVSLLNLIQTGIGTTGAQQLYKFTPGEVQYGKVEDI